ncbi:hypothetical protein C8R44DRAFT_888691 [Mycena epipterygia]|nr:hypothetical protein C8R44DRAFT_888691 [Mycena epipterygia]
MLYPIRPGIAEHGTKKTPQSKSKFTLSSFDAVVECDDAHHAELHDQGTEHDVTAHIHLCARLRQLKLRSSSRTRSVARARRSGLGVCGFIEAALGMEGGFMGEAVRLLTLSEARTRKAAADAKKSKTGGGKENGNGKGDGGGRFAAGLELEILNADAVVLLGPTYALSESYMGAQRCPHSNFTKLFRIVFPHGLQRPSATATSPSRMLHTPTSVLGLSVAGLSISGSSGSSSPAYASTNMNTTTLAALAPAPVASRSIFGRWGASSSSASLASSPAQDEAERREKVRPAVDRSLVGLLGFQHDRALALRAALTVSAGVDADSTGAGGRDVHGVFSGLVLMTFHGVVFLFSDYQADEARMIRTYKGVVDVIEARYPTGALWILNWLVFELAWTLLAQRRHQEAADAFVRLTELNSWAGLDKKECALVLAGADAVIINALDTVLDMYCFHKYMIIRGRVEAGWRFCCHLVFFDIF